MDGYVSKPMLAADLFRTIDETLTGRGRNPKAPASGPPTAAEFDRSASLERAGGDEQLLGEMAALFAAECPRRLQEIRAAVARRDAPALERAAHALRGSVSNFCAPAAAAAAEALETMGRAGNLDGVDAACAALETALERLTPALARLTRGEAPPLGEAGTNSESRKGRVDVRVPDGLV
jgi:HPt (histidine-containing phosphotransfer) domain-containing protein